MDKYPPHDEKYFYKYLSVETAKLILTNRKFRYSSPLLFNDPFDVQTELKFNFEINNFHNEVVNEIIRFASLDEDISPANGNDFTKLIELIRIHIKKEGKVDPNFKKGLLIINEDINRIYEETRLNFNYIWREFLKTLRVFSLSTKYDSILMWSHYAKNHTGVVFKLKVLPEEDNLICAAEPISYQSEPLRFFTKEELINDILGIKILEFNKIYRSYSKIKFDLWSYENEWRVWTFEWDHQNQLFSDYKLFPNELDTIYFGCNSKDENIEVIKSLAININPEVSFYKTKRTLGEYKLQFEEI